MIVEKVLGNINEDRFKNLKIQYANIDWYNSHKKIQKIQLDGEISEIGIKLENENFSRGLLQDDVVFADNNTVIVINIKECDCITIKMDDLYKIAKICYEIGNRHAPLFLSEGDCLAMPYDKPTFELLEKLNAEPSIKNIKIHSNKSISNYGNAEHHHHH